MHNRPFVVEAPEIQALEIQAPEIQASEIQTFLSTEPGQTEFLPWLPIRSVSRLARTCKGLSGLFKNTLLIERLAHHIIVEPNVDEVIKMVSAYLELLNTNIPKVVNHKGQLIRNNKPFSLAFGAGDDEMCFALKEKMIIFYGNKEAAEAEIQKQLNEKIGEENKDQDDQIKNKLNALLRTVIQAIDNEQQFNLVDDARDANNKLILSPVTLAAITTFREGLAALQPKVINKGMHFRLNTLQETYDAYVTAAIQWEWDYNRCALFEDGALSSVLFYVPENDAQKFSQGLYYLQREDFPEVPVRSLILRGTNHNFYDFLRSPSFDFDLSGSRVDIIFGRSTGTPVGWGGTAAFHCQNLCRTKTLNLQSLCNRKDDLRHAI